MLSVRFCLLFQKHYLLKKIVLGYDLPNLLPLWSFYLFLTELKLGTGQVRTDTVTVDYATDFKRR